MNTTKMKKVLVLAISMAMTAGIYSCKDAENADKDAMEDHDASSHDHSDGMDHGHDHDGEGHENMTNEDSGMGNEEMEVTVPMSSKSGSNVSGNIMFTSNDGEVTMKVDLKGLAQGEHAIHLHENGDCSSDDAKSAGGHWNPSGEDHGKWGNDDYHMGDIGNLEVGNDGMASMTFSTSKWCLGCDDDKKNIMNKAVIVHAGADDFESQPSGAAGARVACGVIKK